MGPKHIFFESITLDLYYCCIDVFNKRYGLWSIVWNEGSNWRLRLTNGQMKVEKYFINDETITHFDIIKFM